MTFKKKRSISERFIIITVVLLLLSLTLLGYYWSKYLESDLLNREIAQIAFKEVVTNNNNNDDERNSINHAALLARNKDYVGWLQVEGTSISYPIVQSKEELYYLRRDFDKNHLINGTIFLDYRNDKDFTDTNTVLYGHNMNDGSMFAPMKKFLKSKFFDAHKIITVSIPSGELRYEIFAIYKVPKSEAPNNPGVLTKQELGEFLIEIDKFALYKREVNIETLNNILTLATCGDDIGSTRIVIHAKYMDD